MAEQQPQDQQEAQIRISKGISAFFLGLIGLLSLMAAAVFVGYNANSNSLQTPMGNGSQMPMAATSAAPAKTVTVAMHDPGCHWFKVGSQYKKSMATSGPVNVLNADEAAIQIAGANGVQTAGVGQQVSLAPGKYRITMVGQASDDNHLHLAVS